MDVCGENELYFPDKYAAVDKCHCPAIIDNVEKSNSLDIENFLTTVGDVNEFLGKETELNSPVTIVSCLDALIEDIGELHKFDSINMTISSNFIQDLSVVSNKNVSGHSLTDCAFSDYKKIDFNESSEEKFAKNCQKPKFNEGLSCESYESKTHSSFAALPETDYILSNDSIREKEEKKNKVCLNYKKPISEKSVSKSYERQSSYEINNIEEEKSLDFQNDYRTENFVNMTFEESNEADDIENTDGICDSQFRALSSYEMQLSEDEKSDQSKISEIISFRDSVNSEEIDKSSLDSNSNKIFFTDLNNTVVNFEFGDEEQVIESNISKVKGHLSEKYCSLKENDKKPENQHGCQVLKEIENVDFKEKGADVIKNPKEKCVLTDRDLNSFYNMKSCKVVLERLKLHTLERYLHLVNLNPIQILQPNLEKDKNFNTKNEKLPSKLNRNSITKNVQGMNEGTKLKSQGNAHKIDVMKKHNSKLKQGGKYFSVEKKINLHKENEEEMLNSCSNFIKCSTSTEAKKPVYRKLEENSLLNESFENEQENQTMSSNKNKIKERDKKPLNLTKIYEKRNSIERESIVENDLQFNSKFNGLFDFELLNLKEYSSESKISNPCCKIDKTHNSSSIIKPCKVVLKKLNSEFLKIYMLDVHSFSNLISEGDKVFSSDKDTMLLDNCLSSSPEIQEDKEIILNTIQNKSPHKGLNKTSYKKLNSKLRKVETDIKSLKMVPSKITKEKNIVTELNKNIRSHVLDSDLIKKQEDIQKKKFKGKYERGFSYLKNLKHAKKFRKSNKDTVVNNYKKWMHKPNLNMKLKIKSNKLNKNFEKKSQKVKYNKVEIADLKAYPINECKIVLEKLNSPIQESFLCNSKLDINQISQIFQSCQNNIYNNINACNTREKCVQNAKLKKKHILKTKFSFDTKSKRKNCSTFLKINSSKLDNAIYHSSESKEAKVPVLCSDDSQINPYVNSGLHVNAIDDNIMELDEANKLIGEQIPMKKCNIMLKKCDSTILEKYLGKDWSKNVSKRIHKKDFNVDIMAFEDNLSTNSTCSIFSDSEYEDTFESSSLMDSDPEFDDNLSIEQAFDKKDPKDLFCKSCVRKFKTYSSLLSHKKTHQTYSFKCVLCKVVSKNRESFINHMKRNHPEVESYVCDNPKCEESFQTKKQLSDHQKSHQRYCCRFCKKRYAKKNLLQRHILDCH